MSETARGTIRFFDLERNFGFASPDDGGPDVFLHAKQCHEMLATGDRIEYEPQFDAARGKYWARHIRVL